MGITVEDSLLQAYMAQCVTMAREAAEEGNYPLASMVVYNEEIVAAVSSTLAISHDPTAHPEISAIRIACEKMQSRYLEGAILISTLEPCPMCTSAAIWAKFGGVAFGASQEDAVAWSNKNPQSQFSWRQIAIKSRDIAEAGNPKIWVRPNILQEECVKLFDLTKTLKIASV